MISPSPVPCPWPLRPLHRYGDCAVRFIQTGPRPRLPDYLRGAHRLDCLGPIEPWPPQPVRTGWTGCGKPGCSDVRAWCACVFQGLLVRFGRAVQAGPKTLMQRLTCAVGFRLQPAPSCHSGPSQPSPAQPNSSSPSAQASFITRGTIYTPPSSTSTPDTCYTPYGIYGLTSSPPRQSPPLSPANLRSFQAQTANLSKLPTCTGASRNPRPPNPIGGLPKRTASLSQQPSSSYAAKSPTWLLEDPLAPEAWATASRSSSWYCLVCVSQQSGGGRGLGGAMCANNAAGESAVGKVLPDPVAIKTHTSSSSLTRHPRAQ